MSHTMDQLLNLLLTYKYLIIFPVAVLEGPGLAILCGVLLARNILNPFIAYTLLMFGEIIGDTFYYALGRYGGRPFIKKWGYLIKIREEKMTALEHHFHHHAPKRTLFLGKTQPWGSVILFAAGTAKMNYLKFIGINTFASLIKVAILLSLGYYFNEAYVALDKDLQYVGIALAITAIPVIIYFFRRK
ncbi:DedA family protein [Candidatus Peregrinibacteria bacterium]|nr:DedA family protein [Candidatus Peregrinibacteria bacterium]